MPRSSRQVVDGLENIPTHSTATVSRCAPADVARLSRLDKPATALDPPGEFTAATVPTSPRYHVPTRTQSHALLGPALVPGHRFRRPRRFPGRHLCEAPRMA